MTVLDLVTLCNYNYWGNKKILPVISQLATGDWEKVESYMFEFFV
jgi:hypothetical protein